MCMQIPFGAFPLMICTARVSAIDAERSINYAHIQHPFVVVQELCESRGGRPGLSVLTSLVASVDVKLY